MEITGKIKVINATQEVTSTFKKRELVVTTDEQYPQHIPIYFVQDKCDTLNSYKVGQEVKVSINIRGNEYNGKYFVSLQGWRIEKLSDVPVATTQTTEETDDLPF